MIKNTLQAAAIVVLLGSFSSVSAQKKNKPSRFLDDIEISFASVSTEITSLPKAPGTAIPETFAEKANPSVKESKTIEKASPLQLKYGQLLDVDVEEIDNDPLFAMIDDWYGTPYRYGGNSKSGIDCSAFVQTLFSEVFEIALPRTARDQYKVAERMSKSDIQAGDLLFFNTTGGISHVGYYLQNNKFVHAATSNGVMISDLDDDYWARRFVGVGRIEKASGTAVLSKP